jgi:hypothetical protein
MEFSFADSFREVRNISLKKDAQKKILVKYGSYERVFQMRWTLYTDGALVVFHSYDRNVAQTILSLRDKNSSFRVYLTARGSDYINKTYMLVRFKEFNFEKKEAAFELLLSDKKMQVQLEEL